MEDFNDPIFSLLSSAAEIFGTGKIPENFVPLVKQISVRLLSSQTSDPNCIKITENFQGLIYCLCKLCVVSRNQINNETYILIFQTIIALILHFFSLSKTQFSQFISEFPISFVEPFTKALISNFFVLENEMKLQLISISSYLLFYYFTDQQKNEKNPFFQVISNSVTDEEFNILFPALQKRFSSTNGFILFFTLLMNNSNFEKFIFSQKSEDLDWILTILPQIQKDIDPANELRLKLLLHFTKNEEFCLKISEKSDLIHGLLRYMLSFSRHYLKEETCTNSITISLKILINLSRNISNFDSDTGEMLIGLMRVLQVSKGLGDRTAEYCRLLILFIETVLINRCSENVELLYCIMRSTDVLRKMSFMKEKSKDPLDFARSLINVEVIVEYFTQRMLQADDKSNEYDSMIKYLTSIVPEWKPENILTISPPAYDYEEKDPKSLLKITRIVVLKEVRSIL